jgi:hypothetical protein
MVIDCTLCKQIKSIKKDGSLKNKLVGVHVIVWAAKMRSFQPRRSVPRVMFAYKLLNKTKSE